MKYQLLASVPFALRRFWPTFFNGHWGSLDFTLPRPHWWLHTRNMVAKELYPIAAALTLWGDWWCDRVVVLGLDNEGSCLALCHGQSSNAITHALLGLLHELVKCYGVFLIASHLPRETKFCC
jgi:hypothetical protein